MFGARVAAAKAGAVGVGICATRNKRTRSGCATPTGLASASCDSLSATPDWTIARKPTDEFSLMARPMTRDEPTQKRKPLSYNHRQGTSPFSPPYPECS